MQTTTRTFGAAAISRLALPKGSWVAEVEVEMCLFEGGKGLYETEMGLFEGGKGLHNRPKKMVDSGHSYVEP